MVLDVQCEVRQLSLALLVGVDEGAARVSSGSTLRNAYMHLLYINVVSLMVYALRHFTKVVSV
jgi:hypothetical protein